MEWINRDQDVMVVFVLQNKIVDQCERLQLQSASISKYVAEVCQRRTREQ